MRGTLPAGLVVLFVAAPTLAQPAATTIRTGDIRCADCAESGQQPTAAAFDASRITFVANPIPLFADNETVRINLIARVLQPAPLVLDMLDVRVQTFDRNMHVVETRPRGPVGATGCMAVDARQPIDLASKPVVSALRFNDIITADVIVDGNVQDPESIVGGTPTIVNVRKASAAIPFFHPRPVASECANRSGRLVEYLGANDGELTIVYNDGGIYYRNGAYLTFSRERLSPAERSNLLRAFRDANFDALPTAFPQKQSSNRPSLTLMAARYQRVALLPEDPRLAPLLQHIEALADRATSHAHYLVKSDPGVPIVVKPWTNGDVDLARLIDTGLRLSDRAPEAWRQPVPADVIATLPTEDVIPADFDKDPNRFVYFSQAGRLYRVARRLGCTEARPCTFRDLNPAEVAEPGIGSCEPGTINCQAITYADGRREHTRTDPPVTAISGRLWPASMGVRLHDVPPGGLTFSEEEYKRHQAIYFPIMKLHEFGPNFIEDGIMYSHVRVCLVEQDGDDATCETAHYALKR